MASDDLPPLETSFDKLDHRRNSALFKLRSAAHAVISIHKEKKLAFHKKKMEWKRKAGRYDDVSDQVFKSMEESAPDFPGGPRAKPKLDSREIFYTHDVEATKELCVPCFDGLLFNIKRLEEEKRRRKEKECEQKERLKMARIAGVMMSLEEMELAANENRASSGEDEDEDEDDGGNEDEHDEGLGLDSAADQPHKPLVQILPKFRNSSCPVFITWAKEGLTPEDLFIRGKAGTMAPVKLSEDLVK